MTIAKKYDQKQTIDKNSDKYKKTENCQECLEKGQSGEQCGFMEILTPAGHCSLQRRYSLHSLQVLTTLTTGTHYTHYRYSLHSLQVLTTLTTGAHYTHYRCSLHTLQVLTTLTTGTHYTD